MPDTAIQIAKKDWLLLLSITCLKHGDKKFSGRGLWLSTSEIDATSKAAIEAIMILKKGKRDILKFRHLFRENNLSSDELQALADRHHRVSMFGIEDYTEDENGEELSPKEIAFILAGDENAKLFSPGTHEYTISYTLATKAPVDINKTSISPKDMDALTLFCRDLGELARSSFLKEGPGTYSSGELQTAITDEGIRSFVSIFRRLYMVSEPGCFLMAAIVFSDLLKGHALSEYVMDVRNAYLRTLNNRPSFCGFFSQNFPFSVKRLIDVFLYTRFSHQPKSDRSQQFQDCLTCVNGDFSLLTWLFLNALWECTIHMANAGNKIIPFLDAVCRYRNVSSDAYATVTENCPGIGTLETEQVRQQRVLREKARELATSMWIRSGSPHGGPSAFFDQAFQQLVNAFDG